MRARFGPDYRPRNPEELASTVLRVDAARQLLKPGGFMVGIRSGPAAPPRAIDEATMRALTENYREILARWLSTTASLELVGSPDKRHNGHRPTGTDIDNAMNAGAAIVRARRAREIADHARARAVELRTRQITSTSTVVFGMAGFTGFGLTAVGLFADVKYRYTTVIGLTMAAMGTIGNTLKEWTPNAPPWRTPLVPHRAAPDLREQAAHHVAPPGRPVLRFDDRRHSYATWLLDDGVPPTMMQRMMGYERSALSGEAQAGPSLVGSMVRAGGAGSSMNRTAQARDTVLAASRAPRSTSSSEGSAGAPTRL